MKVECIGKGFVYTWPGGQITLEPGKPIELSDERAQRLLQKAHGRVRVVEDAQEPITIEPGHPHARPVYFVRQSVGAIVGPATVDFVAQVGEGPTAQYWLCVTHEGNWAFVHSIWLRSKKQFDTQTTLTPVDLIRK
ncbi:MAG: hypothetical protein HOP32_14430 [Nitrospira sp.]|nr:hypothetical protein [Nitrospira sp.]